MRTRAFLVVIVILAAGLAAADEVVQTPTQHLILKPKKPIVIDGKLDEWNMAASPYVISVTGKNPMSSMHSNEPTNPVKGDSDLSGRAALAWDEKYLYVAGEMVDDHLMGVKPGSLGNQGPPGWGCDSLMISVASFRQPMKTNSPYSPYPFLGLRYAPVGANARGKLVGTDRTLDKRDLYWILTPNSKWAVTETPKGYDVEAAIPWKDLNFVARPGERLFISFLAADTDPDEALNQVGWGFKGAPKEEPLHRLADRSDMMGMLTVSSDEVPTDKPWAVRAELDAIEKPAALASVRVVDGKGRTVLERAINANVPVGKTGIAIREFEAGAIGTPGDYTIEVLGRSAGNAVVLARLPLAITKPVPAPPMIQNLPGEIHHMPPDRVAHNAWNEHRSGWFRHGFVKTKQDYVPYIERHVIPGLKGACQNEIKTKSRWGYVDTFRCMAAYQITKDPEYIQLSRDIMDYTLTAGDLGWFRLTATAMYRYMTWKQDPKSPWAPKDAEKRYRAHLLEVAAHPGLGLFNESGTHNRVWHRYALLKIARMVAEEDGKPIDPRVIEYTDYHDKLIGQWGDSDDATPGYHWVFFDAALAIYYHTGDWKAFLANKGYVKTLSRYVEMVTPSGACPQFQSSSGWHEVGMSMWAYELMSKLTRDGRYKWTSHRIAEYYYNHLDHNANQYHLPYDTARNNFVMSYLLADDSVAPKAPPEQSRFTWRHPFVPVSLERRRERPGTSPMELKPDEWIPDKAILSSGNNAQNLWSLVELLPTAGHGGAVPGNLITLMIHDAALLAGQGYYENTADFQNLLWIEDLDGLAAGPRQSKTQIPVFVEDPAVTYVRVQTTPYANLPVTYTREIVFVKNCFVLVKDRAKFDAAMKVRLGPCYQARSLGPECGPNWFNAYYDQLYYTGLGLGRGVQAIRNPAWDLLIYFTPRENRKHTVVDRYMENFYRGSPIQLRQVWSGMVRAGQEVTFTSILLPHTPLLQPSHLLDPPAESKQPRRIEVIHDDDNLTVVKVISEMDPTNRLRRETWVMLNNAGKPAKAGALESDGVLAVVRHNYSGKVDARVLAGGQRLVWRGKDESAQTRKHPVAPLQKPVELRRWEEREGKKP